MGQQRRQRPIVATEEKTHGEFGGKRQLENQFCKMTDKMKKYLGIAAMKRSRGGDDVVDSCALVVSSEPAKVVKLFPNPIEN